MFIATFFIISGMLFYYLLKPPHTKKKTTRAEVTEGLAYEMAKPPLIMDTYSAQEAKSSV